VYFHGEKMAAYGKERLENMFAVRSFLDAGIKVTQTSDYPPGPFEPMMALQSSVTRTDMSGNIWGASQKITVAEAFQVGGYFKNAGFMSKLTLNNNQFCTFHSQALSMA
jgi:predicted amidohydrolase YtcJ